MNIETVQLPLGDDPPTARLLYGATVIEALRTLPDNSVHVVCTSPPYWCLRDYGVPPQDWPEMAYAPMPGLPEVGVPAQQVALGLEPDPFHFIGHLVAVFREIRRVLRDDGTLWLNLGDSYVGSNAGQGGDGRSSGLMKDGRSETVRVAHVMKDQSRLIAQKTAMKGGTGLKPKDLGGIPWRVALALQADGWWLRNDIVWAKPACMPEPVKDRCTRNHEYVFMLTKSSRYFYDADAVREPLTTPPQRRHTTEARSDEGRPDHRKASMSYRYDGVPPGNPAGRNRRTVWNINPRPYPGAHFAVWPPELVEPMIKAGTSGKGVCPTCWAPWKRRDTEWNPSCVCGAPEGMEPGDFDVILSPTGSGAERSDFRTTGRPRPARPGDNDSWQRPRGENEGTRPVTQYERRMYASQLRELPAEVQKEMKEEVGAEAFSHYRKPGAASGRPPPPDVLDRWIEKGWLTFVVVPEWEPATPIRPVVLDPFSGSATTGMVALNLDRDYIGIDLNDDFLKLARARILGEKPPGELSEVEEGSIFDFFG